jgi:hypothetical protein
MKRGLILGIVIIFIIILLIVGVYIYTNDLNEIDINNSKETNTDLEKFGSDICTSDKAMEISEGILKSIKDGDYENYKKFQGVSYFHDSERHISNFNEEVLKYNGIDFIFKEIHGDETGDRYWQEGKYNIEYRYRDNNEVENVILIEIIFEEEGCAYGSMTDSVN